MENENEKLLLTNEELLQELSKEQLINLVKIYGHLLMTIDGWWFLGVEKVLGRDKAIKLDENSWRQYAKTEGVLMKKFFNVENKSKLSLKESIDIFLLSPIWGNHGGEAEFEQNKCNISIRDCKSQKERIKHGLGEFPCKGVGIAYAESMKQILNPNLNVKCNVCPPDDHPDDLWCKWEISLNVQS
ncbi:MAG: DUF6125 family protein [Promethearchaeota archaeon]